MKPILITMLFALLFVSSLVNAQAPLAIPYQAVARNISGELLANQTISLRISIHDTTATGWVVYKELHNVTTTALGLFTINIGQGTPIPITAELNDINWSIGAKFIQIEMDATGGATFIDMGTTQLLSVPYALYAEKSNVPGLLGPQGPAGPPGAVGAAGINGINGSTWFNGVGIPSNLLGVNGDYYLNTITDDVYLKTSGTYAIVANIKGAPGVTGLTGATGPQGPAGVPGATGPAGPSGAAGINGINGSTWFNGTGFPSNLLGVNGDYYLNTITDDVYLKTSGTYAIVANIKGATGTTGATGPQGPAGVPGATGPAGPTGSAGINGINGSTWFNGVGIPSNLLGVNGDYYLNTITDDVYLKTSGTYAIVANIKGAPGATGLTGATGPQGPAGVPGATGLAGPSGAAGINGINGSTWFNGTGIPSNLLGVNGDYYLNTITDDVYLKTSGTYAIVANIKGATGATGPQGPAGVPGATGPAGPSGAAGMNGINGSTWFNGTGIPSNLLGVNGDYYLNTITDDVYLKTSGTYAIVANIKGATGTTGATGPQGPAGVPGATGPAGPSGAAGINGINGSTWFNGTGIPSNLLGVNGDYYLNTITDDVYLKTSGTYAIVANIKGATGPIGATGTPGPSPSGTGIVSVLGGVLQTPNQLSGDVFTSGASLLTSIAPNTINSVKIVDGSISNIDISTNANILRNKIASGLASQVVVNDSSGNLSSTPTLPISNGGTGTNLVFTSGSVLFAGINGTYKQDNANFFYDNVMKRLGIGTSTPSQKLDVDGIGQFSGGTTIGNVSAGYFGNSTNFSMRMRDDTNSHLYFQTFGGASTRMAITNSGRVGIGTTTPEHQLDVSGVGQFSGGTKIGFVSEGFFGNSTNFAMRMRDDTNSNLYFQTYDGASTKMAINNNGNVGIGTTTPEQKLDVNGIGQFSGGTTIGHGSEGFFGNSMNFAMRMRNDVNSNLYFQTYDGASTRMAITNNGNVGIGTSTPLSKLDIDGGIAIGSSYAGTYAAPSEGAIIKGKVGIGTSAPLSKLDIDGGVAIGSAFAGTIAAPSEGAIIKGKVGIGTSDPLSKLDVDGGLAIGSTYAGTVAAPSDGAIIKGKVGIGTSSPGSHKLTLIGNAEIDGSIYLNNPSGGLRTVEILNTETGSDGASFRLYNSSGLKTIELDGDYGDGDGRVITNELQITGGSDLAESFDIEEDNETEIVPGMLVSIDPKKESKLCISNQTNDKKVVGVISGANGVKPGVMMGQSNTLAFGKYPIALVGRVYVLSNNRGGEIEPGDFLTTSSQRGYAQKTTNIQLEAGSIIGKAMGKPDPSTGYVLVLINLQ
ncbi:MAG: collagen-like protein [Bacteroidetes bacterium]|nr:collagen-like protein [Bacteroidota bacterium]